MIVARISFSKEGLFVMASLQLRFLQFQQRSESNDIFKHFEEFSNVHNSDIEALTPLNGTSRMYKDIARSIQTLSSEQLTSLLFHCR